MENLRIAITGNLGAGTSTLVDRIKNTHLQEQLWPHLPNHGEKAIHTYPEMFTTAMLEAFYSNPIKHAFLAQQAFLNGRLERQYQIEQAHGIILEDHTLYRERMNMRHAGTA